MKILLRNPRTGLFLADADKWVKEMADARDFPSGVAAIPYALALGLADVELLHAFQEEKYNFALPLRDAVPPAK